MLNSTKKERIISLLEEGKWSAPEIAEKVGCHKTYVYNVCKTTAMDAVRLRPWDSGVKPEKGLLVREKYYAPDKTISKVAAELKITYAAARSYAINKGLPFARKQKQVHGRELTESELQMIAGLPFVSTVDLCKSILEGVSRGKVDYAKAVNGVSPEQYLRNEVLNHLSNFGADEAANKYGLDDEILHNMVYIYENGVCPYTNKPLRLRKKIEYHLGNKS